MLKSFWFWFLVLFVLLQLIPMDAPSTLKKYSENEIKAPTEVMQILKRSCYDCHSSEVNAPWYYNVAPISWFVKQHVRNGRDFVNFSDWNSYDKEKQFKVMSKLPKSIVIRMPISSYLYFHEEAKLTKKDKKVLNAWARALKEEVK